MVAALKLIIHLQLVRLGFGDRKSVLAQAGLDGAETDECSSFLQAASTRSSQARPFQALYTDLQKGLAALHQPSNNSSRLLAREIQHANQFVFIHIPKTAGTSFREDAALVVDPSPLVDNGEQPFQRTQLGESHQIGMVMLRHPLAHVLSQFMECKYGYWGGMTTLGTAFPRFSGVYGGFEEWISHFLDIKNSPIDGALPDSEDWAQAVNYHCYNPWNMQMRYLSTTWGHAAPFALLEPDLSAAKKNLERVQFIGIQELYIETLCMLQLWRHGTVTESCACGGPGPLNETSHESHFVPAHTVLDLPKELVSRMHKLVRQDVRLYASALKRFEKEVRMASKRTGIQMVCEHNFEKVWQQVLDLHRELKLDLNMDSL